MTQAERLLNLEKEIYGKLGYLYIAPLVTDYLKEIESLELQI